MPNPSSLQNCPVLGCANYNRAAFMAQPTSLWLVIYAKENGQCLQPLPISRCRGCGK